MISIEATGWVWLSFIAAVTQGTVLLVNQYFKLPGQYPIFWSRVFVVAALAPVMIFAVDWPTRPDFYAAVLLTAVIALLSDTRVLNTTAKYGGGVTSRVLPYMVWVTFIMWMPIDPSQFTDYVEQPLRTAGILLSIGGGVWFSTRLNRCEITRAARAALIPALVGYSMNQVLNKYAMTVSGFHSGVYSYMFIQSLAVAAIAGVYISFRKFRPLPEVLPGAERDETDVSRNAAALFSRRVLAAGFFLGLGWFTHMVFKNYAMTLTPNPAYMTAITLTSPVWVIAIYKLIGYKEDADVLSGLGIVACAILLSVVTG